jgi:hypothetical protein
MRYEWTLRVLRTRYGRALQRRWAQRVHHDERARWTIPDYLDAYVRDRSVIDVGGMWGIDGEYSFLAAEKGAKSVTLLDEYATEEFNRRLAGPRGDRVRFVEGDATTQEAVDAVGTAELVLCLGVLYHVPSPNLLIERLRQLCTDTLVLETFTSPEVPGVPQAAVYLPGLSPRHRSWWDTSGAGGTAGLAIGSNFDPDAGYGNNFWAPTPSCVRGLLVTNGFRVESTSLSPSGVLRHIFVAHVA